MRGVYRIEGLARYDAGSLHLEYRYRQANTFAFSEVHTRRIPLRDLWDIKRGPSTSSPLA